MIIKRKQQENITQHHTQTAKKARCKPRSAQRNRMLQFNIMYDYSPDDITYSILFSHFFITRGAEKCVNSSKSQNDSFTAITFSHVQHIYKKAKIFSTVNSQLSSIQTSRLLIQLAKISKKVYSLYEVTKNKFVINIRFYCSIQLHVVY